MYKYGIIAVGYNRLESMKRLLDSLSQADYKNQKIDLIISVDYSGTNKVENYAKNFEWKYGEKILKIHSERLGLRNHIMACGNYLNEYDLDAVAIFEDDIYPSTAFFNYMQQAVPFYAKNKNIAGVSLYTHLWNVNAAMPFQPAYGGYDNFFMCFAQSWGQIWTKEQWRGFAEWYKDHEDLNSLDGIPEYVRNWPQSSWLKYHIAYCVDQKKYFVYPYESLTTCMAEAGEHTAHDINTYEVPMECNSNKEYEFQNFSENAIKYDAFFERVGMGRVLNLPEEEICVDLYGTKGNKGKARYWLTRRSENYEVKESFALRLRPHEENIYRQFEGHDIFLYDTFSRADKPETSYDDLSYYYRLDCDEVWLMKYAIKKKCDRIGKRIKKKFGKVMSRERI